MTTQALQLFQLADSALPIGGFAFSSGLEAMAKLGLIQTRKDFLRHLETVISEMGNFDLPFMNSFYQLPVDEAVWREYHSMLLVPHIRKASAVQGRGLIRLFHSSHGAESLKEIERTVKGFNLGLHYLPVLTIGLKEQGFSRDDIAQLYLFGLLRDQISAAVRIGLIGPMEGQRIQSSTFPFCSEVCQHSKDVSYTRACRTGASLEVAQACHPRLYSKLFQN